MQVVHVAVAVITNSKQEVLVALRQAHQHQGGLWEFPGGKVDENEAVYDALVRETQEELGIVVNGAQPLIQISHQYDDKAVLLDVWDIEAFSGKPQGLEGQKIRWCAINELNVDDFPAANKAIIAAVQSVRKR